MKFLHLEDNEFDAELLQPVIHEEWPDVKFHRATNRANFLQELSRGGHDLILSDFSLDGFNGLEALEIARRQCPTVPFIFLSGTIGEERAVEAMRSGASDYVIKDRPRRLVPAIRRALDSANEKRVRLEAEEKLLRVQRLENIGMLAAGIAHDFNNVLAPVLMAVPLLRGEATTPMQQKILNSVEKSAERGAALVKEILGFAHGVTGEPQILQPKHVLRDLSNILRQTLPSAITIEEKVDAGLWPIRANPTQLHQVLLNLCVNARDAMNGTGTLTIRATNRRLDAIAAAASPGLHEGPFVALEVSDTGAGIPPEILQKIWEPFFTTKGPGKGTGLGLSTVRTIVESHHGAITVRTGRGQGTTFETLFPALPDREASETEQAPVETFRGHGELLLVADDDPNVRELTSAILARYGYRVIAAADGAEALSLFGPRSLEIHAIVTDIGMPVLDGCHLAKVARKLNPTVRLLGMTGTAEHRDRFQVEVGSACLAKPFTMELLLGAIHNLFERSRPS